MGEEGSVPFSGQVKKMVCAGLRMYFPSGERRVHSGGDVDQ